MTDAVAHRGPDGRGTFVRDGVAFGHRRLAIIDPVGSPQPMVSADARCAITYNGEVYNYRELREELRGKGHTFRTSGDTEVVLAAYQHWGRDCVERLRGMFAFAIADFGRRELILARDRLGIKPLVYRQGPGWFAFGSELSVLREVDAEVPAGSLQSVEMYLRYQYIPAPYTVYRDTFKLPSATTLVVDFAGAEVGTPRRYWDVHFEAEPRYSEVEWQERVSDALVDSVRAHLVADVPFGVFLSGGIDSTLVAGRMARLLDHPVRAFAIDFKAEQYSEVAWAREAAQRFGVELITETVDIDALTLVEHLVDHYGEPFGDSSAVPTWQLARLARRHVPMVLSGDGGDEVFGGYHTYAGWMRSHSLLALHGIGRRRWPRALWDLGRQYVRGRLFGGANWRIGQWEKQVLYFHRQHRLAVWRPEFHEMVGEVCSAFDSAGRAAARLETLAFAQYLDLHTYLPGAILPKVDIASMAHGLEVRPPLLDAPLVELAARLPRALRMRGDVGSSQLIGKWTLKAELAREFPERFIKRRKQGFAVPLEAWFRPGQPALGRLRDAISRPGNPLSNWFSAKAIAQLLNPGTADPWLPRHRWLMLMLAVWCERNPTVSFG